MAIYHLHAKIGSNGVGHSAGAKCAYITRTENYVMKADECAYTGSGNMPKWPNDNPQKDPAHYWKTADKYERDNGRLFRELEFSLPRELTLDQQKALCHAFADKVTTLDKGGKLPFTFAIHVDEESHNPHCHLMISERVNDGINRNASTWFKRANSKDPKKGGAIKTQELNGRQWLNPTREAWAVMVNDALQKAGIAATIDHRSHKDRKLDELPSAHLGRTCTEMIRRGAWCHRGPQVMRQNIEARLSQRAVKFTKANKDKKATQAQAVRVDGRPPAKTVEELIERIMDSLERGFMAMGQAIQMQMEAEQMRANQKRTAHELSIFLAEQSAKIDPPEYDLAFNPNYVPSPRPASPFAISLTPKPSWAR
ncbi:MobA/MobL family protein [Limnohabitans sp.]|uniref:MobA/MobL family protein n=1 Tax=Limnohabitans sp. TaxID=1907725 RepID=UPI0028995D3A|nr:MobA/MobL family protein [Limnohabitans sp.]